MKKIIKKKNLWNDLVILFVVAVGSTLLVALVSLLETVVNYLGNGDAIVGIYYLVFWFMLLFFFLIAIKRYTTFFDSIMIGRKNKKKKKK